MGRQRRLDAAQQQSDFLDVNGSTTHRVKEIEAFDELSVSVYSKQNSNLRRHLTNRLRQGPTKQFNIRTS